MSDSPPPPLPGTKRSALDRRSKALIGLAIVVTVFLVALAILRVLGLIRPFSVPTGAMTPAIARGDHFMMEGFSFLVGEPDRGDIIVFKTDGITSLAPDQRGSIYIKRVAGMPGERLRIADSRLYVNDKHVGLEIGGFALDLGMSLIVGHEWLGIDVAPEADCVTCWPLSG